MVMPEAREDMMAQQAAPRIKMLNIVGLKMVWATRDKFSPATCSTGSTPAATMDISAYTTATVRQMSRIPMGIVLRGFLVAGMTETGAMVVPWQAKDIMAMAPIRPPKPPEKNWPSALEKYPGCTWGRPAYLLYNKFGWLDSPFYLAIWVHCAFATETYFVYQLIQFMRNVPRDLDEAAAIDGCSSFQTLYKVIVPMLGPALVSCALFQFMWSCNDFMGPLLYVSTPGKYPMSLFVKLSMDGDTGFAWNKILALSLISILPQLIVFFCAQDQFVEGISAGAVKG